MKANKKVMPQEIVRDLLYLAKKYVARTPATEATIFDHDTHEVLRIINYHDTIERAKEFLAFSPLRNCDAIADKDLVDEFCKSMGYHVMDERNGYADGLDGFMREHWFEFSHWITMPYESEANDGGK